MPVPRLIAAFITEGYYSDHVGTLNFSSHIVSGDGSSNQPMQPGPRRGDPIAANTILNSLKDLSDEAQAAAIRLPSNPILFMNPLTRDMSVGAIKGTVPRKYLPLYGSAATPAPLDSYIYQIFTLLRCEEEEIIIALVLLAKISTRIPICSLSVARMFFTAMVVATKLRADERISMQAYATFGGVPLSDLLAMERAFLTALGFDAGVRPEEFGDMVYSLRHYCVVAASEGVEWITEVWCAMAPKIPVPDLRHLTATEPIYSRPLSQIPPLAQQEARLLNSGMEMLFIERDPCHAGEDEFEGGDHSRRSHGNTSYGGGYSSMQSRMWNHSDFAEAKHSDVRMSFHH